MKRFLLIASLAALAGCGVQHQTIRLDLPAAHVNPSEGKPLVITSIVDGRQSLFGNKLSADEQSANVGGVFRGGNGIAVDLEDETAISGMKKILTQALRGLGYKVISANANEASPTAMAVTIEKFAVDMPFDFWRAATYSQHMLADIQTSIVVNGPSGSRTIKVSGHGQNVYQRVTPENWQTAMDRAVSDYTNRLQTAMLDVE